MSGIQQYSPIFIFMIFVYVCLVQPAKAEKHCEKAKNTADLTKCLNKEYEQLQESLRAELEFVEEPGTEEAQISIQAVQTSWFLYRDSQCAWEAAQEDNESLKRVKELSCYVNLSEERLANIRQADLSIGEIRENRGSTPLWINTLASDYPDIFWSLGQAKFQDLTCDEKQNIAVIGYRIKKDEALALSAYTMALVDIAETGKASTTLLELGDCSRAPSFDIVADVKHAKDEPLEADLGCHPPVIVFERGVCSNDTAYMWDGKVFQKDIENKF